MLQRFRSRGCIVVAVILGIGALVSCGGLFLITRPQSAPDLTAELKQFPLYPNTRAVVFSDPFKDSGFLSYPTFLLYGNLSGSTPGSFVGIPFSARIALDVPEEPVKLIGFYVEEFNKRGWTCGDVSPGPIYGRQVATCHRKDEAFPQFRFTDFDSPGVRPPWVKIYQSLGWRRAEIRADTPPPGSATTSIAILIEYIQIR